MERATCFAALVTALVGCQAAPLDATTSDGGARPSWQGAPVDDDDDESVGDSSTGGGSGDATTGTVDATDVDLTTTTGDESTETTGAPETTSEGDATEATDETEGETEAPPVWGRCAPSGGAPSDPFIDCVELFDPAPEASFGQDLYPAVIYGPPRGGGQGGGSLHVLSLGCGGAITVFFDDPIIADGPGPDFIVFENAFGDPDEGTFTEPARVSVSLDGVDWREFPCQLDGQGSWPPLGCAGVMPVESNPENGVDPTDPDVAGGDAFDLAQVGLAAARYVRLTDAAYEYDVDAPFCGASGGFDLDAVAIVHSQ